MLRIATDATFPPFHYKDDAGAATGFELALARLVAERAGFEPMVVVRPYDELLSGLATRKHDMVAATTGVTPERERQYLFSTPYFETCQAALVRAAAGEPATLADLRGHRVGAAGAGTSARALQAMPNVERVPLGKGQEGVPTLEGKGVDALILDEYSAVRAARASSGRLRVLPEPVAHERYAFVLARGRDEVVGKLDRALAELEREGRVGELRSRFAVERDATWPVLISSRPRGRDLGIPFANATGPYNAITDVPGVAVGHATIIEGEGKLVPGQGPDPHRGHRDPAPSQGQLGLRDGRHLQPERQRRHDRASTGSRNRGSSRARSCSPAPTAWAPSATPRSSGRSPRAGSSSSPIRWWRRPSIS